METAYHVVNGKLFLDKELNYDESLIAANQHGFSCVEGFIIALNNDGLYGYMAFYKGKTMQVWSNTAYNAQTKAAKLFNAKKQREVDIILCIKDGEKIPWTPTF